MNQDFNYSFTVQASAGEAFDAITRVSEWWTTNVDGNSEKLGDVFTVHFGKTFVTMEITEWVRDQKILWMVSDCWLDWLADKKEWNGTSILWEVQGGDGQGTVKMTHIGLHPALECYNDCREGWSFHTGESLLKLIRDHKGMPDTPRSSRQQDAVSH
jgi:hypothetical protein